jgi:hypothetical protein
VTKLLIDVAAHCAPPLARCIESRRTRRTISVHTCAGVVSSRAQAKGHDGSRYCDLPFG